MDTLRKKKDLNFTEGLFNYFKNHEMEKCGYLIIEPSCNGYPHVTKGDCSNAVNSKSVMDKMGLSKHEMKQAKTEVAGNFTVVL